MAQHIADRVKETTTSTGTGALTLGGAMVGFRAFSSVLANADTCYYALQAVDASGALTGDWEVGVGTYTASGNTLARTKLISSSTGALVNLSAGTKQVWIDQPAAAISGPAFSAFQSSAQTLTAGVWAKLIFQSKEFDTTNAFDAVTNNRFQPTVAGYYAVTGAYALASVVALCTAGIYKNGALYKTNWGANSSAGGTISALVFLNGSTDYIELWARLGSNSQTLIADSADTWFQATFVRVP